MTWAKIAEKFDDLDAKHHLVDGINRVGKQALLKTFFHATLDEYVRELLGEEEEVRTKPHRVEHGGISNIAFDVAVRNKFRQELLATHQQNMKEEQEDV